MNVLVVNASHWISEIGARLSPDCDFAVIWYYDHKDRMIKVSLRAFHDHVDVSEIAKRYAGGGHIKAAGFTLTEDALVDDLFDVEDDCLEDEPEVVLVATDADVIPEVEEKIVGEVESADDNKES